MSELKIDVQESSKKFTPGTCWTPQGTKDLHKDVHRPNTHPPTHTQQAWTHSTYTTHTAHTGLHTFHNEWRWWKLNPTTLWVMNGTAWGEMWRVKHEHDEFFPESLWIIYRRITEPKIYSSRQHGREWVREMTWLSTEASSTLLSPGLMTWWSQRTVRKWVREAGSGVGVGVKMADGDEDVKILNVCAVIVSVGEIIVSCTV